MEEFKVRMSVAVEATDEVDALRKVQNRNLKALVEEFGEAERLTSTVDTEAEEVRIEPERFAEDQADGSPELEAGYDQKSLIESSEENENVETCDDCGKEFRGDKAFARLRTHESGSHNDNFAVCDSCGEKFDNPQGFGSHNGTRHDGEATYSEVPKDAEEVEEVNANSPMATHRNVEMPERPGYVDDPKDASRYPIEIGDKSRDEIRYEVVTYFDQFENSKMTLYGILEDVFDVPNPSSGTKEYAKLYTAMKDSKLFKHTTKTNPYRWFLNPHLEVEL